MDARWEHIDPGDWDALHRRAAAALQQDWAYGEAMARLGTPIARAWISDAGNPVALASFTMRRVGGLVGILLCTRGPVWADGVDIACRQEVYRLLRRSAPSRRPRALLFSPEEADAAQAGADRLHHVMSGYATVIIDLQHDPSTLRSAMDGNWRNRLNVAEGSPLRVVRNGTKPAQYQWLLDREAEQRRGRAYRALPLDFVAAYQAARGTRNDALLVLRADIGRDAVAGMMFLMHGEAATYHIGWGNEASRRHGAHNLLLWNACSELRSRGIRKLDLGGVNTGRGAALARFKIGTGGDVVRLAGTFV